MNKKNKHKLQAAITTVALSVVCCFLAPIGVKAAPQEYTLTLADVEYTDNGAAGIRIEGLKSDFATNHSDLPEGNWTMVIPNTMDIVETVTVTPDNPDTPEDETVTEERVTGQYTVTELAKGTNGFNSTANKIEFEDNCTITRFYDSTFSGCEYLKFFEFPSSATTLGAKMFSENTMTSISFDEDWENATFNLGLYAGVTCQYVEMPEKIKTLIVPSGWNYSGGTYTDANIEIMDWGENSELENAPEGAAGSWTGIKVKHIRNLPAKVKTISRNAFFHFPDTGAVLQSITFAPNSELEVIGKNAFGKYKQSGTNSPTRNLVPLKEINLPLSVKRIEQEAFAGNGMTSITGTENVEYIGEEAFAASNISTINIPNTKEIVEGAFQYSYINTIELPDTLTKIPVDCFYRCERLNYVYIPDSITYIGGYSFNYAGERSNLKAVPNALRIEGGNNVEIIGKYAFSSASIGTYNFSGKETYIGNYAFSESGIEHIVYTDSPDIDYIPEYCFSKCTYLTDIEIPDNIKHLKQYSFNFCSAITEIELPELLETIGNQAFYNCSKLVSVTIPNSVVDIGSNAFQNCSSLTEFNIDRFASWALDSDMNKSPAVAGEEGYYFLDGTKITEIRFPETIGVIPYSKYPSTVKKYYIQGPNVVGVNDWGFTPDNIGAGTRLYFDEETKLRPALTRQVTGWSAFNAIFANGETYDYLKSAGLTNVYKRQTEIELSIVPSANDVTLTATLTADGSPDNRIAIYYEDTYGRRVEVASQACSTGKTLSQTITNDNLPVGNLKYIAVYEPTDPDGWYACEDIQYYDKGVSNCHFDTIEQEFSATGDLILKTPVICDTGETPRGNVKVYLGENASGKLLHEYHATVGQCSISHADLPYGDNEIFIEFLPSDVGMGYCNTTTSYNKPAVETTLNATVLEYNNTVFVNTNITPAAALTEGEVSIYLGDEVTGIRMNEPNTLYTYIPSDYIKKGDNKITVVYQSPDGHYKTAKQVLNYNFDGGEPTLKLNIYTERGFVHFAAILEDYEDTCSGTIRIYKGYDNTGELIYGGSAPTASTKLNLHTFDYGNQTYFAEFISSNMDNKNARTVTSYNRESKGTSIIGEVTTISDTTVRVAAYAVDQDDERPVTKGKVSIYRGSSSAGVLVTEGNCDGNPISANLDRDSLQVGINEFFIVYYDSTEEYATSTMSIIYTRLSSTEGGTELDKIYGSYEEQLRSLILQIEENNKAWQKKLDEIQASIDAGLDLSELNAKIDALEDDIADLNLKLGELNDLKSLINDLRKDIQNIEINGGTGGNVDVDIDMDEFERIIERGFKEQLEDIEKLLEKFENGKDTEFRLSEKDLQKIKELLDYSAELDALRKDVSKVSDKVDRVSEKIDNLKFPEVKIPETTPVVNVDMSKYDQKLDELYNNIKDSDIDIDDLFNKLKALISDETEGLHNEINSLKDSLDKESEKNDNLALQLEELKKMNENRKILDWLWVILIVLMLILIAGFVYFAVTLQKMNSIKGQQRDIKEQLDEINDTDKVEEIKPDETPVDVEKITTFNNDNQ